MYIQRKIDDVLLTWQRSSSRKPLLIRGARQVGKSTAVRNLSKQFDYFIEINFYVTWFYAFYAVKSKITLKILDNHKIFNNKT